MVVAERPNTNTLLNNYKGKPTVARTETFEVSIPNIKKHTDYGSLSNGMQYALLKKPAKGDKIYANFDFKIGDENSLSDKNIIPALTARMLKNGTATKSKKEINDLLDKIKTSIDFSGNAQDIYVL